MVLGHVSLERAQSDRLLLGAIYLLECFAAIPHDALPRSRQPRYGNRRPTSGLRLQHPALRVRGDAMHGRQVDVGWERQLRHVVGSVAVACRTEPVVARVAVGAYGRGTADVREDGRAQRRRRNRVETLEEDVTALAPLDEDEHALLRRSAAATTDAGPTRTPADIDLVGLDNAVQVDVQHQRVHDLAILVQDRPGVLPVHRRPALEDDSVERQLRVGKQPGGLNELR